MTEASSDRVAASLYADTLGHISLISRKRDKLREAQIQAEHQLCHRIACDYNAGRLTDQDLCDLYDEYRAVAEPGFGLRWGKHMPYGAHQMHGLKARLKRLAQKPGPWSGEFPFGDVSETPPNKVSVVYVLFQRDNTPCYVGSTEYFRSRLRQHDKAGKRFTYWTAHPCVDREAAYVLEERLLREYKPFLNRKAGR